MPVQAHTEQIRVHRRSAAVSVAPHTIASHANDNVVQMATAIAAARAAARKAARKARVAQAAYFRAEKRGFKPGYELDDWLAAEAEVACLRFYPRE